MTNETNTVAEMIARIESFAKLKEDWNSYGALPVSSVAIEVAKDFVRRVHGIDGQSVTPTVDSGVGFEWIHKGGAEISIEILKDGRVMVTAVVSMGLAVSLTSDWLQEND